MRPAHLAFLVLLLPGMAAAQPAAPRYEVEPCCDLCPAADYPASYQASKFLQGFETLIQGKEDWLFREEDLRTSFGPDAGAYAELRRLRDALKARGVDLVLVYQPTRGLLHADKLPPAERRKFNRQLAQFSYSLALQRFRNAGLIVPDFTRLLNDDVGEYFFRGDHHWTPDGARRTAQIVAETVRRLPAYNQVARRQFVTERSGVLIKKAGGTLKRAAAQICGFSYPDQYVDRYATVPVDAGDLFAEEQTPEIVLLGTSNSEGEYNFAGFLAEYLEVDVLNASVTGGKHDGSLLRYLPSAEFQTKPPKVIIWEFEPIHNLSSRMFFRQAIPLVNDGCAKQTPILKSRAVLRGEGAEVLFNGGGQVLPLLGKDHFIDIKLDNPTIRELKMTIWYTNGSKESANIKYSGAADTGGRFVLELRNDGEWGDRTFMSMDLKLPEEVTSEVGVDARLCRRQDPAATGQQVAGTDAQ